MAAEEEETLTLKKRRCGTDGSDTATPFYRRGRFTYRASLSGSQLNWPQTLVAGLTGSTTAVYSLVADAAVRSCGLVVPATMVRVLIAVQLLFGTLLPTVHQPIIEAKKCSARAQL